jgi:hypothetical protein
VYDVRAALFGLAGRLLAGRVSEAEVERLDGFVRDMEDASRRRDFDAYYPLNLAFHEFIVDAAGNATLAGQYRAFVKKLHLFRARSLVQGGGLAVSNREHREMLSAIAARDPSGRTKPIGATSAPPRTACSPSCAPKARTQARRNDCYPNRRPRTRGAPDPKEERHVQDLESRRRRPDRPLRGRRRRERPAHRLPAQGGHAGDPLQSRRRQRRFPARDVQGAR